EEERWYNVEVLILKYTKPEDFSSENWPEQWTLPQPQNSVDLDRIDTRFANDFQPLPADAKTFGGMVEKIQKSTRFEILSSIAWRQRGLDKEQAVGVHIHAGRKYTPQAALDIAAPFGVFEPSFNPEVLIRKYNETVATNDPLLYELEGEIKIVLSRYLHVYTDLLLLKPVTLTPADEEVTTGSVAELLPATEKPLPAYRITWADKLGATETLYGINIKSHRRMRSGELHHLDHPLLGILIQVKPVESKKP
ncbi:MAG TPA: CsiV family protein, partial [Gammaproteobacteria bacterium]